MVRHTRIGAVVLSGILALSACLTRADVGAGGKDASESDLARSGAGYRAPTPTTGHLRINVWCNRTTGQGHDRINAQWVAVGNWANGKKAIPGSFDFGGWTINDRGGFEDQGWNGSVASFSLYPGQRCEYIVSLSAESDWWVGDVLKGLGLLADALFSEYTGGTAGPVTNRLVSMLTSQEGEVGTITVRFENVGGRIYCEEVKAHGATEDRGTDGNHYHNYLFNAGRAEYFFGVKVNSQGRE